MLLLGLLAAGLLSLCQPASVRSAFQRIAEREILAREDRAWAEVRIAYESPGGDVAGEALVEAHGTVMTLASSGTDPFEEVVQYGVTRQEGAARTR